MEVLTIVSTLLTIVSKFYLLFLLFLLPPSQALGR